MKKLILNTLAGLLIGVTSFCYAAPSGSGTPTNQNPGQIWNLEKADLLTIINEVSRATGKNFIVDPTVNGKVTIISSEPIPPDEVYSVFLSILQSLNYSAVPSGDVIKIVPANNAKQMNTPVVHPGESVLGDETVVRVVALKYASAPQMVAVLRPLMPQTSHIAADQTGNTLILTGRANNLQRMVDIIQQVDTANQDDVEVIRLKHAVAAEVVQSLSQLKFDNQSMQATLAADDNTNSILVGGSLESRLRIKVLVAELDTPTLNGGTGAQVIYLRYLKAEDLAPVLMQSFAGSSGGITSNVSNDEGASLTRSITRSGAKDINIVAEPNTNALLVMASPKEMFNIKSVVARLDVRPAEVLIEAAIVQVDEQAEKALGIRWGTLGDGSATIGQITGNNGLNSGTSLVDLGKVFSNGSEWSILLSALETNTNNNILATPNVTVLDNQEAKIEIGQQISITTGSYTGVGTEDASDPFTTSEYQDVGLYLNVTPRINRGNSVQLLIDQGNSTVIGGINALSAGTNPPLNTEKLKTTVIVNSGDILVLGGLIQNQQAEIEEKIPLLGDIPWVGDLFFTYKNTINRKTNLMIFLHPVIIENRNQAIRITGDKYNYIRDVQQRWSAGERNVLREADTELPAIGPQTSLPKPFANDPQPFVPQERESWRAMGR